MCSCDTADRMRVVSSRAKLGYYHDSILSHFNELAIAYRPITQIIIWFVEIDTNFKLPKLHLKVHEEQVPISVYHSIISWLPANNCHIFDILVCEVQLVGHVSLCG